MAEASIEQGNVSALGTFALEATFNGGVPVKGDQTVFGRIRFRVDGLTPNSDYTITHPYGKDIIKTDSQGEIKYTEDIGAGGGFEAALNSRIGTFYQMGYGCTSWLYGGSKRASYHYWRSEQSKLLSNRGSRNWVDSNK